MKNKPSKKSQASRGQTAYRITVRGSVPGNYSERLAGMRITTSSRWDQESETVLEGRMQDQAELIGALNTLYELHTPILKVETLENEGSVS